MVRACLEFHALPSEVIDWVSGWQRLHHLYVAFIWFFPTLQSRVVNDDNQSRQLITDLGIPDEIWMSHKEFRLESTSRIELSERNAHRIHIYMPNETKQGIRQGLISSSSSSPGSRRLWQIIAAEIESNTMNGMWVVNPRSGEKAYKEESRYSRAVVDASQNGVKLLTLEGGNLMSIK